MQISKEQLQQIIKEEIEAVIDEKKKSGGKKKMRAITKYVHATMFGHRRMLPVHLSSVAKLSSKLGQQI